MVAAVRERQAAKRDNPVQAQETYAQLFEVSFSATSRRRPLIAPIAAHYRLAQAGDACRLRLQ